MTAFSIFILSVCVLVVVGARIADALYDIAKAIREGHQKAGPQGESKNVL